MDSQGLVVETAGGFYCSNCTFYNGDIPQCAMCEHPRDLDGAAGNDMSFEEDREEEPFEEEVSAVSQSVTIPASPSPAGIQAYRGGAAPGTDPNQELLNAVISKKSASSLQRWVGHGANTNHIFREHCKAGRSALCYAVQQNDADMVNSLVGLNADVNMRMDDGETALSLAIKNKKYDGTDMTRLLLSKGADVSSMEGLKLNVTMEYWMEQARIFPVDETRRKRLAPFNLSNIVELPYCVIGQRFAMHSLRDMVCFPSSRYLLFFTVTWTFIRSFNSGLISKQLVISLWSCSCPGLLGMEKPSCARTSQMRWFPKTAQY